LRTCVLSLHQILPFDRKPGGLDFDFYNPGRSSSFRKRGNNPPSREVFFNHS
jgi:hypothetical protein